MEEPLQKSLERYDVLDRIAVGGMAEVFLAKAYGAHGFEKTLAIKRILPELASDPEFAARFIAEAKVAVRLSHANVVQVFDFGRIGESLFIAMEFVDGLDLAALLRRFKDEHRQVPLPAAFHVAIEIVRALDFAHSHNVVHRDVSPSNILISRAGEVKIADFGIAIAASSHRGGGAGPRKVMGKWRYMSPEQARGDSLDTRSDLFSAAAVMFELFTGEKLFPGDEAEDIIRNIEAMPIPRMTSIRPGLPSRLDDVLGIALARKTIDRPTRPAAILRSLIELSYESSIMATALDVAEAVASVLPVKRQGGRGALDDVIRRQLADQSVARRTAVTDGKPPSTDPAAPEPTSTGLFRKTDSDGLSRLEEAEAAEAAEAANAADGSRGAPEPAPARRRVATAPPRPRTLDPTLDDHGHDGPDEPKDRDRRTEIGEPPIGREVVAAHAVTRRGLTGRGAGVWAALAVGFAAAGGLTTWRLTQPSASPTTPVVVAQVVRDPAPADVRATLELDSSPGGAVVTLGDHVIGSTPRRERVSGGVKLHVKLELRGYQAYEDDLVVEPGKTLVFHPRLATAPAMLHVETTPPGVSVALAGQLEGVTPLTVPATAGHGVELALSRAGYEPIHLKVDLTAGEQTAVIRELRELQKFGTVLVLVGGAADWGYVWYKGKNLGQNYTMAGGQTPFKLPVGRQQLRIEHPQASARTVTVDVVEHEPTRVTVTL
ncbi:MAG TPA: serine/threonine-protein kinase [Kofleriaceae bacterium]|jgi:serine/threonine protein kinase|nr:serine/threonine-protein kinase [Kofleriaceae bacterium]